jgi:putative ABC transport system permease protein
MKSEIKIPFFLINRYLLRGNKWKLFLIIFLMSAAFINLVFVTSLFNGIIEMSNRQIIDTYTGNVMITPKEGSDFIEDLDVKLKKIDQIDEVLAKSAQISVPASLESRNIKRSWPILAINPDDEKQVTNVSEKMIEGEYLAPDDDDKIIIGRQIAGGDGVEMNAFSFKGAKVGDKVTMAFDGVAKDYTIKGIFYTKFLDTDERAFITEKSLNQLVPNFYNNKANSIILKTTEGDENRTIELLRDKELLENFNTWEDVAGLMKTVTKSFLSINILLSIVGVLIAAFTIFIVIYIDIVSKRQQIGILRAIGIKPYLINALYVMQTVVYSCFGVILGAILLFGIIVPYFNYYPFSLPIGDATLVINYGELIIRTETIIIVAILAGLIPAIATTKMKLLDAIWGR